MKEVFDLHGLSLVRYGSVEAITKDHIDPISDTRSYVITLLPLSQVVERSDFLPRLPVDLDLYRVLIQKTQMTDIGREERLPRGGKPLGLILPLDKVEELVSDHIPSGDSRGRGV